MTQGKLERPGTLPERFTGGLQQRALFHGWQWMGVFHGTDRCILILYCTSQ